MHLISVDRGDDGHLVNREVFLDGVNRCEGSGPTAGGNGGTWLAGKGETAGVEGAIQRAEETPGRVPVVNGGAENKTVRIFCLGDEFIHRVVFPDADAGMVATIAAGDAVLHWTCPQMQNFDFYIAFSEFLCHKGKRCMGAALAVRAAIDKQGSQFRGALGGFIS